MKKEIETEENIKFLVETFYAKVDQDELLAPIFKKAIGDDWSDHLDKMYKFWGTQLLGTSSYFGAPFPKHAVLQIKKEHFERWIAIFIQNIDEHFYGLKAQLARQKALNIAQVFMGKMGL